MPSFGKCVFCCPRERLILEETENFLVIREPYPLVSDDHRMIISKDHYGCCGELGPKLVAELMAVEHRLWHDLLDRYGQVCSYEHGRAGACHARDPNDPEAPACHHFHLHILPCGLSIHSDLDDLLESWPVTTLADVVEYFYKYGDYLYFRDAAGSGRFYAAGGLSLPPHYMRTLISRGLGSPELADWEAVARSMVVPHAVS